MDGCELFRRVAWEAVLTGKAVQEGWTCFKKNLKGAGAGRPCVPAGKISGVAEQRAVAVTKEKTEFMNFGRGASHSGGLQRCHEVMQGEN